MPGNISTHKRCTASPSIWVNGSEIQEYFGLIFTLGIWTELDSLSKNQPEMLLRNFSLCDFFGLPEFPLSLLVHTSYSSMQFLSFKPRTNAFQLAWKADCTFIPLANVCSSLISGKDADYAMLIFDIHQYVLL